MRPLFLRRDTQNGVRKILIDMAYLAEYKKIRLPKVYFSEGLYLPNQIYRGSQIIPDRYYLTKDKIIKEDEHHYFFDFPFKAEEVEDFAN